MHFWMFFQALNLPEQKSIACLLSTLTCSARPEYSSVYSARPEYVIVYILGKRTIQIDIYVNQIHCVSPFELDSTVHAQNIKVFTYWKTSTTTQHITDQETGENPGSLPEQVIVNSSA